MQKLFVLALCVANSIVFSWNICSREKCKPITYCAGTIRKGYCGRCDVCFRNLFEGERCLPTRFLDHRTKAKCEPGTVCNKTQGMCIKKSKCESIRDSGRGLRLYGSFFPLCKADGSFYPVQCFASMCRCITKYGKYITKSETPIELSRSMNCKCARDQFEYGFYGKAHKVFNCASNGNYKTT